MRGRTLAITFVLCGALLGHAEPRAPSDGETRTWLWAWERAEDLRFLGEGREARDEGREARGEGRGARGEGREARGVGVAYLARTITVARGEVRVRPRRHPLLVSETTPLTAVVRVEVPAGAAPAEEALDPLVREAAAALEGTRARRLQIDFDARASEVAYYKQFLGRLRAALPAGVQLSMTALASWCADGRSWLASPPPVDEVVPMLFSMGPDAPFVRAWVDARGGFSVPACQGAVGISPAEPVRVPPEAGTIYAFSPTAWTRASFDALPRR